MQGNINYLQCPVHTTEYIQLICLTCTSNSLACPLCLDASHNLHEVISLKKFMTHEVPKLYYQKPDVDKVSKSITNLNEMFKNYVEKFRKEIGHEINQLEIFLQQNGDRLKQQLVFVCGDHDVKNLHENAQAAKLMVKGKKKIPSQSEIDAKLSEIETKMSKTVNQSCIQIRRIIFKLKNMYDSSSDILLNSKAISHFQFSENYRHPGIALKGNKLIAMNKNFDNVYHSCVVMPPLCPFHNQITFQIKNSQHKCIWLGVADLEVVAGTGYENSYKAEGANYWIWQAGGDQAEIYAENSQNRPLAGWSFEAGDRIKLSIEFLEEGKKTLHIIKNSDENQKYSTPIDPTVGSYYPCISLGDEEESVSIINSEI